MATAKPWNHFSYFASLRSQLFILNKVKERKKEIKTKEEEALCLVFFHSLCSFHSNAFSLFLCGHGTSSHHFISPSLAYNYLQTHTQASNQPSNATEIVVYSVYSNIFNRWCYYLLDCFVLYILLQLCFSSACLDFPIPRHTKECL